MMLKNLFKKKSSNDSSESNITSNTETETHGHLDSNKIKALVAELTQADELFKNAGFLFKQLEIEIGLSSKINCGFKQFKSFDSESENKILSQIDSKSIIYFVLLSLFKSTRMQSMLNDSELVFDGVEIEISNPPSVKTIFKRKELESKLGENLNNDPEDMTQH